MAVHSEFKIRPAVWCGRCGRISVYVCQDGVKVEIVNSERQTAGPRDGTLGAGTGFRAIQRITSDPTCAMRHGHAPFGRKLWVSAIVLVYTVHAMVRFGGCSPRRGFSGAQQSHNDTHSLFIFSLCVPAYCFFVKLLLYRRYRRVRTSRAEKSAPVSGVPESGVASSVRRAESSRAGRPRGGPVPGGASPTAMANATVLGS